MRTKVRSSDAMKRDAIKKRPSSDTVLDGLEPEDKEYRELDGNGLYFRVQPNGKDDTGTAFNN